MQQQASGVMRGSAVQTEPDDTGVGPIRACVSDAMERYLAQLDGDAACDLHKLVLEEVEPPLFAAVMRYCQNNQTRAAQMLGMNRATLRKKLLHYGLV
ncbi:DNA-binding transcriptional regulator Fis [Natronocella acetinitrilica]|nr:DNA-binding transcriptional regulator Fis [Natronocella acetinitrilica]